MFLSHVSKRGFPRCGVTFSTQRRKDYMAGRWVENALRLLEQELGMKKSIAMTLVMLVAGTAAADDYVVDPQAGRHEEAMSCHKSGCLAMKHPVIKRNQGD